MCAGNRQDEGATKKCLEAYDTDSSLMAAPLTDLCSGESQEEERICGVSREKVSFFFSVLPLKKEPCPCTVPLSSTFVSGLLKEYDSLQGWLHRSLVWDPAPTPLPPRNPLAG